MESILKYKLNTLYPAEFIHYTAEMRDAKQVPGSETCSAYTPPHDRKLPAAEQFTRNIICLATGSFWTGQRLIILA